jgi:hypothetical protein
LLFKSRSKVGWILESYFQINVLYFPCAGFHFLVGRFEAFVNQPFLRSKGANLLEIPFECSQTASRKRS